MKITLDLSTLPHKDWRQEDAVVFAQEIVESVLDQLSVAIEYAEVSPCSKSLVYAVEKE